MGGSTDEASCSGDDGADAGAWLSRGWESDALLSCLSKVASSPASSA